MIASIGSRLPPKVERDRKRIHADSRPPRGFVAIAMQLAVMESADGDRVLVADFPAEGARLGEADVVRFARRAAADGAGLVCDEFAMLLVPQANGLGCDAARSRFPWQDDRDWR